MRLFKFFLFLVILLTQFISTDVAQSDVRYDMFLEISKTEQLNDILIRFSDQSFSIYLENATHYNVEEHQTALRNLFKVYREDYSTLEKCMVGEMDTSQKLYSRSWVDDLIKSYGKEYVTKNFESIKILLLNMFNKHNAAFCREEEKAALYSEFLYVCAVRGFFNHFIEFYNSWTDDLKISNHETYKLTVTILQSASDPPLQRMLFPRDPGRYLAIENRVSLKKDVLDLIINHPTLSRPFPLIQAVKDLNASIDK